MRSCASVAVLVHVILAGVSGHAGAEEVFDIGSRRELFVDRLLIDKIDKASLRLHEPRPAGTVFRFDQPWEGAYSGFTTIFKDGDIYRMYYLGYPVQGTYICYAESRNGVDWKRPDLGQFEFKGSKKNNILALPGARESFAPFRDPRPGIPAEQRYKALGNSAAPLRSYVSADGIHWKALGVLDVKGAFDSHNVVFYSEVEKCFVAYFRTFFPKGYRWVGRSTSKDFVTWTPTQEMEAGDSPAEHIYTSSTTPYFRAPHLYLAVTSRFMAGRDVIPEDQRRALGIAKHYLGKGAGFNDMPLMTSRAGTTKYDRTFLETFIRPGLGPRNWTSRANYPAWGIVPTPDSDTQLSMYVNHHTGYESNHLVRYTLRYDGFVSVHAPFDAKAGPGGPFATVLTKPFRFAGKRLALNYATSAPGHVRVEIQDAMGQPIQGFALKDCPWIVGDEIERSVAWKGGVDVSELAGRPVRLLIEMQAADLYAFQFVP